LKPATRRTETDANGEETEREIPFMKGYTVFGLNGKRNNAEEIVDPSHTYQWERAVLRIMACW